jgi:hypothetical protein
MSGVKIVYSQSSQITADPNHSEIHWKDSVLSGKIIRRSGTHFGDSLRKKRNTYHLIKSLEYTLPTGTSAKSNRKI